MSILFKPLNVAAGRGPHRRLRVGGLALVVLAAVAVLVLVLSSAFASKGVLAYFGNASSASSAAGGEFSTASSGVGGVAVNKGSGDVYVVDRGNDRVEEFTASGGFVRAFGANVGGSGVDVCTSGCVAGTAVATGGGMSAPQGVAVSQETGNVYVTDEGYLRVDEFNEDGVFIRSWGDEVVSSGPDKATGFDVCTAANGDVCKTGVTGAAGGEFASTFSGYPAVAPAGAANAGNVLVADPGNRRVEEFTATGEFVRAFGFGVIASGPGAETEQQSVAVKATGGTFTLTYEGQTTGNLAYNVPASGSGSLEEALNALSSIGGAGGHVSVSGGPGSLAGTTPYIVTFGGSLAGAKEQLLSANATNLTISLGTKAVTVAFYGLQVCAAAAPDVCQAGVSGSATGAFFTADPTGVAESASGAIYTVESGSSSGYRVQRFTPQTGPPVLSASVFAATTLSGSSTSNTPLDVAVDPVSGDVYVVKGYATGEGSPPAASEERRVLLLNPAGELLETDIAGAEISSVDGIAENPTSGQVYLTSTTGAQRVYIIDTVPAPVVTLDPTTEIKMVAAQEPNGGAATLNGTIEPDGGPLETSYQFEYSTNGTTWTKAPASAQPIGAGTGEVPVSQKITGLEPNQTYQVRLTATKPFDSATSTTEAQSFTTPAIAPVALMAGAWWNEPAGIELSGQISPANLPTSYYFQYGPCPQASQASCAGSSYEERVPASAEASAGTGDTAILVHQQISGLQTAVAYHYRLVATSGAGTTDSPEETIASHDESYVIEQVTPVEKQAHDFSLSRGQLVAPSGEAVVVSALAGFLSPEETTNFDGASGALYVEHRTATGWKLFQATVPFGQWPGLAALPSGAAYSRELTRLAVCDPVNKLLNGSELTTFGMACGLREEDGSWLAGAIFPGEGAKSGGILSSFLAVSSDLSRVFFVPEDPLLPADTLIGSGEQYSVYEVEDPGSPAAVLRLVNVNNSGAVIGGADSNDHGIGLGAGIGNTISQKAEQYHAVSENGDTVYFTGTPSGGVRTVYARVDHAETVAVSGLEASQCTRTASEAGGACDAPAATEFQGASANGAKVFFTTTQQLVNADTDATEDVYEYDFDNLAGHRLVQVSAGGLDDPTPGAGADVQGVISTSSDGSHVYFVAQGVLTTIANARGEAAVLGADNVYGYDTESGETKFVGEVCSGAEKSGTVTDAACPAASSASDTPALWEGSDTLGSYRGPVQETPDGNYLVFATYAKLIATGPEAATNNATQVYRYDFQTGELIRVSVGEPSFPASGNGNAPEANATIAPRPDSSRNVEYVIPYAEGNADDAARAISENGETIVFTTPMRLQASDVNGGPGAVKSCPTEVSNKFSMAGCNVYVWRYSGPSSTENQGAVGMVSDGQDAEGADEATHTIGGVAPNYPAQPSLSANGANVFFATRTLMIPGEAGAEEMNVYDARIDGGFAGPPAEPACSGEACQGEAPQAPSYAPAAGSVFAAGQNLSPPPLVTATETTPTKPAVTKAKALTRAQKLVGALKACRKQKAKSRRKTCEATARKRYGPKPKAKTKAKKTDRGGSK